MQATSSPRVNATQHRISILDTAKENAQEHGTRALINTTKENLEEQMENCFKIISLFEGLKPDGKIQLSEEDIEYLRKLFDPKTDMLYIEIFDSAYYETKNIIYQETAIGLDQFRSRKSYDDLFDAMLNHFESEGWIITRGNGRYQFSKKGTDLAQVLDNYFRNQAKQMFRAIIHDHLFKDIEETYDNLVERLQESQDNGRAFSPTEDDNIFIKKHIKNVSVNNPRKPKEEYEVLYTKISRDSFKGIFEMLKEDSSLWQKIIPLGDRYRGGNYMHPVIEEIADEIANDVDLSWGYNGTEGKTSHAGVYENYIFQQKTATEKKITTMQKWFGGLFKNPS